MKYIISYSSRQKELIEYALDMARTWHDGDIKPVVDLMLKAFKRHHPKAKTLKNAAQFIHENVQAIRDIDMDGTAFGKTDILNSIHLSDTGETTITEEEAWSLLKLTEKVARLL